MKTLECSTKGDKRFSALCAYVKAFGENKSIENWYQLSKSFNGDRAKDFKQAKHFQHKGISPTSFFIDEIEYDIEYISQWYTLLWIKYLDNHKYLVEYASQFDEFTDCFRNNNTINCQADVIRDYILDRDELLNRCKTLLDKIKHNKKVTK